MADTLHEALAESKAIAAISYNTQSDKHIAVVTKIRGSNTQVAVAFFKFDSAVPSWTRDDNFYASLPNIGTVTTPAQRFIFNLLDLEAIIDDTGNGGYVKFFAINSDGS